MGDIFDAFTEDTVEAPTTAEEASRARYRERQIREQRRRKRRLRSAAILTLVTALLVGLLLTLVPRVANLFGSESPIARLVGGDEDFDGDEAGDPIEVTIPEGSSGADMAAILDNAGIIKSRKTFIDAFTADPGAGSIQPGTYMLPTKIPAQQALDLLKDHDGQRIDLTITVPEGFTARQVHERVANVLDVPLEEVEAAAGDAEAIGLPAEAKGNPEGWYAPGTELFAPTAKPAEVLARFVANRALQLDELGVPAEDRERTLIVASIIEREVNLPEYYPQVARVIENRLADSSSVNGRLQMDSTVLYGVGKTGGIPTKDELENDNPYNTYRNAGLPPTPIGSPGAGAIKAAQDPADGDWLYFVTVDLSSGETLFSATLDEHNENVKKLNEWIEAHPDYGKDEAEKEAE
ncbi:MAG: endolytic transglycosylase MltG [Flaviflexus sp.]|nr:endolytic transglycosylase MltG [Flaviflexus sp.]